MTYAAPGLYFWGYQYWHGRVAELAVWCAGLDCGDHAINADGSVYVPFGSDPDGLFTPEYLIEVSNNPPPQGFGPSACNIDLTDTPDTEEFVLREDGSHLLREDGSRILREGSSMPTITRIIVDAAVGILYTSTLQLLRPNSVEFTHSQYGPSLAETRRLHQYGARLVNTQGISVGVNNRTLRPAEFAQPDGDKYLMSQLYNNTHWAMIDDNYNFDGMIMVSVERPYPTTVVSLTGFMKTYARD